MLPSFRIALAACLILAPCSAQDLAPSVQARKTDPRPNEAPPLRTNSDLVVIDVVVHDKSGHLVKGLPQSDFRVFEDKREQTIASFEEHGESTPQRKDAPPPLPSGVYTNLPQYSKGAPCVVLLDGLNTRNLDLAYARAQLLKFLNTIPAGTPIAVYGLTHDLRMIQEFTTDPAVLQKVLRKAGPSTQFAWSDASAALPSGNPEKASEVQDRFLGYVRVEETLNAFDELAHYLSAVPGRKSLVWFSGAFPITIGAPTALDDFQDYSNEIRETDNLLTRARVAVYPVDARGIMTLPTSHESDSMQNLIRDAVGNDIEIPGQWARQHYTMTQIADDTGGKAFYDTNAVGKSAAQVIADSSGYYSLAYVPASPRRDEGFRKIEVRLKEEHYDLAYRRGYFGSGGPNSHPTPNLSAMTAAMLHGAPQLSAITFEVEILKDDRTPIQQASDKPRQKFVGRYRLGYSIDPHHLETSTLPNGRRRLKFEIAQAIFNLDGKRLASTDVGLDSDLTPAQMKTAMQKGILVNQKIDAPADGEFLRVGIRDASSGQVGSLEIALPK